MSHHDKPPYTPRGWHSELQPVVLDEAIKRAEAAGRDAAVARAKREIDSKYGHEISDRQNGNPRTQGHLRDNRKGSGIWVLRRHGRETAARNRGAANTHPALLVPCMTSFRFCVLPFPA